MSQTTGSSSNLQNTFEGSDDANNSMIAQSNEVFSPPSPITRTGKTIIDLTNDDEDEVMEDSLDELPGPTMDDLKRALDKISRRFIRMCDKASDLGQFYDPTFILDFCNDEVEKGGRFMVDDSTWLQSVVIDVEIYFLNRNLATYDILDRLEEWHTMLMAQHKDGQEQEDVLASLKDCFKAVVVRYVDIMGETI